MSDLPKIKALLFMKGHSERVPKKNIKPFCGRPLLHWILETLTLCRYIDEIVLNTDDFWFGGHGLVDVGQIYPLQNQPANHCDHSVQIYLPARSAQVLAPIDR